jgi:hypothetical protein
MKKKKRLLYYIYCALGEKSHPKCNKTADKVAFIRLFITSQILITNFFIIFGVVVNVSSIIHHWNDNKHEIPSHLPQNQKEKQIEANRNFL